MRSWETNAMKVGNLPVLVCGRVGVNDHGVVFEYDPAAAAITYVKSMDDIGANGATGRLVIYNNKLYGCALQGGAADDGVIFEYNPATHALVKKVDLQSSEGQTVYGSLTVYNNKLYGLAAYYGPQSNGVLFEYDPLTNNYTPKVAFDGGLMGGNPNGSLTLYNNKLYGFTKEGGIYACGVLFEYNPTVNGYTKKVDLSQSIGRSPSGNLSLYNNKLYGIALWGGTNDAGIIYSYDLRTQTFSVLHNMHPSTGAHKLYLVRGRGLTLFNNKFYGVTQAGGLDDKSVIFEFDPATNTYTKKLDFATVSPTITEVSARMTVFNNKLYGIAGGGGPGGNGVLYEYDPATNGYKEKVHFSGTMGSYGIDALTCYNNKLYGVTRGGGVNSQGVIYEYNPAINGFLKLYDFEETTGWAPVNSLVPFNNKLYGTAYYGATQNSGVLFEFDPASKQYTVKYDFSTEHGMHPSGGLCVSNNKIYGMTMEGGDNDWGVFYEFDPLTNTMVNKIDFNGPNGRWPQSMEITKVPAPTAEGKPGVCDETNEVIIDAANKNQWIAFTNANGDAVAEINPNGNILGRVVVHYYVHDGDTRKDDKGNYYLNRNISIEVQNQPTSPVNVRLYIRDTELDALIKTTGSGVFKAEDVAVFKNQDLCSPAVNAAAAKINATVEQWGWDYAYSMQVNSFSSFYFASTGIDVLPIGLSYFKGNRQGNANKLEWKAECTNGDVDFIIERSANGQHFDSLGIVWATQESCNKPFTFLDDKPLTGNNYYRLHIKEKNGDLSYSKIVLLGQEQNALMQAKIIPNPVVDNQATLQINTEKKAALQTVIIDVMGRVLLSRQINVEEGLNTIPLQVQPLKPGIYQLIYNDGEKNQVIRFVKH